MRKHQYILGSKFSLKYTHPENHLLIFSDPRSGSTWLAELLTQLKGYMIIDEPFHLNNNQRLKELNWGWRQVIPSAASWAEAKDYFQWILKRKNIGYGRIHLNSLKAYLFSDQSVFKIIRGKGVLPWLVNQFEFNYTPIFLIRNPYAVVSSMISHPSWNYPFEQFKVPETQYNDIYKEHEAYLTTLNSKEEQLVALWCIVNKLCIEDANHDIKWMVVKYEDLVLCPKQELKRIFQSWGIELPIEILEKVSRPSSTYIKEKPLNKQDLINGWKSKLTATQIDKISIVLQYFNIEYDEI